MLTNVVSCDLMGGLGNQLFQVFTTFAYALRHSRKVVFPYTEGLTVGIHRPTYWKSFLKNLTMFTTENVKNRYTNNDVYKFVRFNENGFHYTPIPEVENHELLLYGYFQSHLYFEQEKSAICSMIQLSKQKNEVRAEYASLFQNSVGSTDDGKNHRIIGMHFRLGDYKQKQSYHPIMPVDYYINALGIILSGHTESYTYKVLYFCEKEDNARVLSAIDELKEIYSDIEFIKVDDSIEDWKQMLLMSLCHDNIIANSSFSWWGAHFNDTVDKIVCYPCLWFGPAAPHNVRDLCPSSWQKIYFEST